MRALGIDLGTTTIKGGVLNLETGTLEAITRRPFPGPLPGRPRLHHEVDPDVIVAETRAVLEGLLAEAPEADALTLCSQMHGLVLTDARGAPLGPALTWQDQRAAEPGPRAGASWFQSLLDVLDPAEIRACGNDLWVMRPLSALYWMAGHGQLPRGARVCALPDFVAAQLCGHPVATEVGHATASSMFDLTRGVWHREMLARLGLGELSLPALVDRRTPLGVFRAAGRALTLYPPIADQQCSLRGAGLQPGELSINVSTGSQVGALSEGLQLGDYQTRPYFDGRYLNTWIHVPAGRSLNALVRLLSELAEAEGVSLTRVWETIDARTQTLAASDLRVDLSFFAGALGDEGSITRIREDNLNIGALFNAAFDSMAANYHALAGRIRPGRDWTRLVFSGGLVLQMPALRARILHHFDCPYRLAEGGEDALMGLLLDARARMARA